MEQENKSPTVFVYNQNYEVPDIKSHFFATQIQTLILVIFITAMMQYSNHLALYLIYCCPIYFFLAFIQWLVFWKPKRDLSFGFNIYNLIMFIICSPIFFGVIFGIFHPTASLEFKQAQNCQVIGKQSNWIGFTEKYSIIYINFEYEGKQYLGQACASNLYQAKTSSPILPYKFYYKFDRIQCGPIDGNSTDPQYYNRILSQNYFNQNIQHNNYRTLKRSRSGGRSSRSRRRGSSSDSCNRSYLWVKVKIASWLCMENELDVEDYMEPQSCYVNFFNGDKAVQNGILRASLKDQQNFPRQHISLMLTYLKQIQFVQLYLPITIGYYHLILYFSNQLITFSKRQKFQTKTTKKQSNYKFSQMSKTKLNRSSIINII
ncbi:hypothetical protein ABPG72_022646 [Tetrahymena utriculariae]